MSQEEPQIIPAREARQRLQEAIVAHCGQDWDTNGWLVVHRGDYLVRLNKGERNVDFACDLLGQVSITETPITPLQASGRVVAWMVLGASMLIAFAIAWATGIVR
jgi:hypothetical protein